MTSDEVRNLSSELLLNVVQKEYEYESERNKGLQTRAGMFISFIGIVLTLLPNYINIKVILEAPNETIGQTGILLVYLFLIILVFLCLIISLILFVKTLSTKQYKRLKTNGFNEDNVIFSNEVVALELMKDYKQVLEHNIKVNDNKAKIFQHACILLSFCIISIPVIMAIKTLI